MGFPFSNEPKEPYKPNLGRERGKASTVNYRHIYHAGNFADVFKHAVLTRIVCHLKNKDKAFRVIDTHAGPGLYDLSAAEAEKTGEWKQGIGRLLETAIPDKAGVLLAPYLNVVRDLFEGTPHLYPGSPKLVRALLRRQDRLSAIELHPRDHDSLQRLFNGDFQARIIALDGWLALGAHVPPKERRGLVLVDPPFEKDGEFDRMVDGLARAHRRWSTGIYMLWYPIKADSRLETFHDKLRALGIRRILCAELTVLDPSRTTKLAGSGLVVVNPPFTLERELKIILPALRERLSQAAGSADRLFWIVGEE